MRRLLAASALSLASGCASLEGAAVLENAMAGTTRIVELASAGDEVSVKAIPDVARAVHDGIGTVLLTDYGQESLEARDWDVEVMRRSTADLRDAHRLREGLLGAAKSLPYVGPGISWMTGAGGALVMLIATMLGKRVGKTKEV